MIRIKKGKGQAGTCLEARHYDKFSGSSSFPRMSDMNNLCRYPVITYRNYFYC